MPGDVLGAQCDQHIHLKEVGGHEDGYDVG